MDGSLRSKTKTLMVASAHEKVLQVRDQDSISQNSPGEPCLFHLDLRKLENCALEAALGLVEPGAGAATMGEPRDPWGSW